MTTAQKLYTAEDLLSISASGKRCELIKGELREMAPSGGPHGEVSASAAAMLVNFNRTHRLGRVFGAETGFKIERDPDTVRAPDAAFVSKSRLPEGPLPGGFLNLAPDLAVEVVSPSDSASDVQHKAEDWLDAGVRLLWVIYPETGSVVVYRSRHDVRVLTKDDPLEGGDVLPGFRCSVQELLDQ